VRLFVAIALPAPVIAEALGLCRDLERARWSRPDQLHLTLRFLGEIEGEKVSVLRAALREVHAPAFSLGLSGVGVFPRRRRPAQVLWTGVIPEEPLRALETAVSAALAPHAPPADHPFSPHLTLARFREDPGPALSAYLAAHASFLGQPWLVEEFRLYRSTLGPGGAVHDLVERYPLAGP
jgi:2'-5' RNA ligase